MVRWLLRFVLCLFVDCCLLFGVCCVSLYIYRCVCVCVFVCGLLLGTLHSLCFICCGLVVVCRGVRVVWRLLFGDYRLCNSLLFVVPCLLLIDVCRLLVLV